MEKKTPPKKSDSVLYDAGQMFIEYLKFTLLAMAIFFTGAFFLYVIYFEFGIDNEIVTVIIGALCAVLIFIIDKKVLHCFEKTDKFHSAVINAILGRQK